MDHIFESFLLQSVGLIRLLTACARSRQTQQASWALGLLRCSKVMPYLLRKQRAMQ